MTPKARVRRQTMMMDARLRGAIFASPEYVNALVEAVKRIEHIRSAEGYVIPNSCPRMEREISGISVAQPTPGEIAKRILGDNNNGRWRVYIEGYCPSTMGPGAYGVVMLRGNCRKVLSQGYRYTTKPRMYLRGAIEALEKLKSPSVVTVYCGALNRMYAEGNREELNTNLWTRLSQLLELHRVEFHASGDWDIESLYYCGELARQAITDHKLLEDNLG